jgi:hypothetical protein
MEIGLLLTASAAHGSEGGYKNWNINHSNSHSYSNYFFAKLNYVSPPVRWPTTTDHKQKVEKQQQQLPTTNDSTWELLLAAAQQQKMYMGKCNYPYCT